jgi:hypothetical protein
MNARDTLSQVIAHQLDALQELAEAAAGVHENARISVRFSVSAGIADVLAGMSGAPVETSVHDWGDGNVRTIRSVTVRRGRVDLIGQWPSEPATPEEAKLLADNPHWSPPLRSAEVP